MRTIYFYPPPPDILVTADLMQEYTVRGQHVARYRRRTRMSNGEYADIEYWWSEPRPERPEKEQRP